MHTKPDLRVFLKWMITRSGSVITDVITPRPTCSMIDNTYAEFVFSALRVAPLVIVVAVIAFAYRRRLFFVLGFTGCFLGFFFDHGGSTGGHLDHATTRANSYLFHAIVGATLGITAAYLITKLQSRKTRKSIDKLNRPTDTGPLR